MRLEELAWPLARIPEIFEALASETGLPLRRNPLPDLPDLARAEGRGDALMLDDLLEGWLRAASRARGLSAEGTAPDFLHLNEFLLRGGPALVLVFGVNRIYTLALLGSRGKNVRLLLPDQRTVTLPAKEICDDLQLEWQKATRNQGRFVETIGLSYKAQESLRSAFLNDILAPQEAAFAWMLQSPISAPLGQQVARARLGWPVLLLGLSALGSAMLSLLAWYTVGSDALSGRVDGGRLWAWSMVLFTTVPLVGLATHAQGQFALRLSLLLKRVLLQGCINLPADKVRVEGLGHQLALVSESGVLEQFAVSSSFVLLVALANLGSAIYLFWLTPSARHLVALMLLWVALVLLGVLGLYRRRFRWTGQRLGLTNDLISKMSGHRTRRVQQAPSRWHEGEDEQLADYWQTSASMDGWSVAVLALPRAWLLVGAIALLPVLLEPGSGAILAAMVGLLLSVQSLQSLLQGLMPIVQLKLAADFLREPLGAAQLIDERPVTFLLPANQRTQQGSLIELFDVVFRFREHGVPVLRGCNLSISTGERLLLEGSSGGGKSTLASLIAGSRTPESGLILVADLDHHTLNREAWRRVVSSAPQFHENHVFANTLSFNLLLGRRWPPSEQDVEEAIALCDELGLGPLLARMPNGIHQLVGEMGWQLSHGEKSRVFIARALLQRSDLLVLDESFGALDPETLELCMAAVLRHAKTLLVIAHP